MNHGVLFVDTNDIRKHSSDDWGLVFDTFNPPFPSPKTDYVEIDGGQGSLDLTEAYGKIYYKNTSFNLVFNCLDSIRYELLLDKISNFIHGKLLKIFLYYDEEYYYEGRVEINKYASTKSLGKITLKVNAKPYRFKKYKTIEVFDVVEKKTVVFKNNRMETTPTFKSDKEMTFKWKNGSYTVNEIETAYPQVEFIEGDNILEFVGNGRVTVSYQEGKF